MRGTPYVHGDFRGGLNTKAANYLLEDTQCRDCLNVQSTSTGAIVKREGISTVATQTGATLRTIHVTESTGTDYLIVSTDTALYKKEAVASSLSLITSGFSDGNWSMVETTSQDSQGPLFMVNGVDSPSFYNAQTFAFDDWTMDADSTLDVEGSPVPNGRYLLMHDSRVVVAGVDANPSTLYWSEVQVGVGTLPRRWMIENQQLFDPNDGDEITGIGKVGSNLLVFKKHKVFVVYDLNTGASRRLTTNIGCVAPKSIVETPVGTFFLSDMGVYVTNGSSVELVSDLITPTIRTLQNVSKASADFYRNHYYLSVPDSSVVLDYDLTLKSWWKHDMGAISDLVSRFNSSVEELYCVSGENVGRMFTGYQDFGSSYQWYWKGPWLAPGQARVVYPAVRKRLRAIRVDGNGTCTLKVAQDFSASENQVTPQNADGSTRTTLFPAAVDTRFGDQATTSSSPPYQGTRFGDYYTTTNPPSPYLSSTIFADVQGPQQSRVWGQGVARSWSLVFGDTTNTPTPAAATIQNYTIFMQERNQ